MKQAAPLDSAMMLAALGIIAYAASMMTHEALGHGGYCLAAGGHQTMLTAFWETCQFPGAPASGIKAAGPVAQFSAGLLAWLMLHFLSPNAARLRYFLWLYLAFDLLVSSGYVAFSGITDLGDAAELINGLHPRLVWRGGLILVGSLVYFFCMRLAAVELKRFAGIDDGNRRLFRLILIPYAAAGIFACCTGALTMMGQGAASGLAVASPAFNHAMGQWGAMEMAALSSFGAASGMFALPAMQHGLPSSRSSRAVYLKWNAAWGAVAAAVIVVFFLFIGPGLQ